MGLTFPVFRLGFRPEAAHRIFSKKPLENDATGVQGRTSIGKLSHRPEMTSEHLPRRTTLENSFLSEALTGALTDKVSVRNHRESAHDFLNRGVSKDVELAIVAGRIDGMKRIVIGCVVFGLGLAGGASVRLSQHWQHGYRAGYSAAALTMRCEAVREGHGHWELNGREVGFRWNPARSNYRPDHESQIPSLY